MNNKEIVDNVMKKGIQNLMLLGIVEKGHNFAEKNNYKLKSEQQFMGLSLPQETKENSELMEFKYNLMFYENINDNFVIVLFDKDKPLECFELVKK